MFLKKESEAEAEDNNMNLSTKAALFNALILPGWGQFYLNEYKKGIGIIIATVAGILSIIWSVVQTTIVILKIAPLKKGTVTFSAVVNLAIDAIKALNLFYIFWILLLMILLWIFSIIDAYQIGKKQMTKSSMSADQQSASPEA